MFQNPRESRDEWEKPSGPTSQFTAARETQAGPTVEVRQRKFKLPRGWWAVHGTSRSGHDSRFVGILYTGRGSYAEIVVARSQRGTTLTFTLRTAATNRTPHPGRAGTGCKASARRRWWR